MRSLLSFVAVVALAWTSCQSGPTHTGSNQLSAAAVPRGPGTPERPAIRPNPLVSRDRPVEASGRFNPPARVVVDGQYRNFSGTWNVGRVAPDKTPWVAIDIGRGPTRLLLVWSASGSYNYNETDYGSPGSYRVETSEDSTNGTNGTWRTVASVSQVATHAGEQAFDFDRQRWVRFVVTSEPPESPNGVQLDEIDVHDISAAADDTWFFMGDSITAFVFDRQTPAHQPSFATLVHQWHPPYFPAMINGGIGGEKSDEGLAHVDDWIALCPDVRHWGLLYGSNDAAGNASDASHFKSNMQAIVDRLRSAGRVAILARIPYASDHQHDHIKVFNEAIDAVAAHNGLLPGPDLYAWFRDHPDELRDGLHPTDKGILSINRLWAEAMASQYQ